MKNNIRLFYRYRLIVNTIKDKYKLTLKIITVYKAIRVSAGKDCYQFFTYTYTGCPRRKGPNFGRVFLRSNYTDITQNTYIQISMVTEILNIEK